jgi:serine/threonine protein kinase
MVDEAPRVVDPTVRSGPAGRARPDRIGRYEILEKVGAGGMGTVYRARDSLIHRVVALKAIPAGQALGQPEAEGSVAPAELFEREARAAGALLHPAIVTLYDAGRDGDFFYLAMEFVDGETFAAEIARSGSVPVGRAVEVAADVADALDYAHQHGVVHRDIKPSNLMILPDKRVKVTDFGIARLTAGGGGDAMATIGLMVGTPSYMSPEQIEGGHVDGRSDVFSLGVVLYEALTGTRPFRAPSAIGILNAITTTSPEAPHLLDPRIPEELSQITLRAMARRIDDRYERCADLAAELRRVAAASDETATLAAPSRTTRTRVPTTLRAQSAPRKLVAGFAVLLTVAGSAAVWRWHERPTPVAQSYIESASTPPGAELRLDGEVIGRTPYTFEVRPGTHEIEFRLEGYYPAQATINVPPEANVPVNMEMVAKGERP